MGQGRCSAKVVFILLFFGVTWNMGGVIGVPKVAHSGWPIFGHDAGLSWDASSSESSPLCHPNCKKWDWNYKGAIIGLPTVQRGQKGKILLPLWDFRDGVAFLSPNGHIDHVFGNMTDPHSSSVPPILFDDGSFVLLDASATLSLVSSNLSLIWQKKLPQLHSDDDFFEFHAFVSVDVASNDLIAVVPCGDLLRLSYNTGEIVWKVQGFEEEPIGAKLAVGLLSNGSSVGVYHVGSQVVALSLETGTEVWRVALESSVLAVAIRDERVFVGARGVTKCLTLDNGERVWRLNMDGIAFGAAKHSLFVGINEQGVIANLNSSNGMVIWKSSEVAKKYTFYQGITILQDIVCGGTEASYFSCLHRSNGTLMFKEKSPSPFNSPPVVAPDGRLLFVSCLGCDDGASIHSIDPYDTSNI